MDFDKAVDLGEGLSLKFFPNGHILGSAFVHIYHKSTSILFSGDIGRPNDILMNAPVRIRQTDYLVVESTYGNRLHDKSDPQLKLATIINQTTNRNGIVLIPIFA